MKNHLTKVFGGCCLFVLAILAGCGESNVGTVSGVVTLDGKPLDKAIVTFSPAAGGPTAIGRTDDQGNYELYRRGQKGAAVGVYNVTITSVVEGTQGVETPAAEMSSDSDAYLAQAMNNNMDDYAKAKLRKDRIPAKYNTASTLSKNVDEGPNVIDLELTSD